MTWFRAIEALVLIVYIAINLVVAKKMTAKNMYYSFIDGQCIVGMICANIFYTPAWFLKGIKFVVLTTIK